MEIEKLLLEPESKTLEFKKDLSSLDPIIKTIVAFANTAGGILVIGYSQAEGIVGLEDIFHEEEKVANVIADSIRPSISPEIEIVSVVGKNLLLIHVAHWKGPFYLKKLGTPQGIYMRLGSTSRPADATLIAEMQRQTLYRYFDEQPLVDLSLDSLDKERAQAYFAKVGKKLEDAQLLSLGICVLQANRLVPSIGGLILFGKNSVREQFLPCAKVCCARFQGKDKTYIIDRLDVQGTILDAIDEVPKFIRRNTRLAAEIRTIQRQDVEEYPSVALREALINAFAHCDYSIPGSSIQISIFEDRLEIQNPGMLPLGFTLENLKEGTSRIRNRVIARVFNALHFMEEWGSGYRRILAACHAGGYKEPLWQELGTFLRVTFYPHNKTVLQETSITMRQQDILSIFTLGIPLPFREIVEKIPFALSERALRYELTQLKAQGLLSSQGKGRATMWVRTR
ncbi:MAG: hypothetical protein FJZ58_04060 [Chlamydiae bacterium]|nr:hypothetical protein [Chlamydiota bacterium]